MTMHFSMLKLIDRSACSFEVPDFDSEDDEIKWGFSLSINQRMELLYLMNEARWGKAAMRKPIDRTKVEILTMDEFRVIKDAEHAVEQA